MGEWGEIFFWIQERMGWKELEWENRDNFLRIFFERGTVCEGNVKSESFFSNERNYNMFVHLEEWVTREWTVVRAMTLRSERMGCSMQIETLALRRSMENLYIYKSLNDHHNRMDNQTGCIGRLDQQGG